MIIYEENGNVCSCSLMSSVPEGITGYEVDAPADKEFRDAWAINAGNLDYDLTKAKAIKVKEAKQEASDLMKVITDNYSSDEIATWDTQKSEAKAANKTGFLNQLAINSGILVDDLITNVLEKVTAYESLSAESIGRRKKKEVACMAATTIEELKAVTF